MPRRSDIGIPEAYRKKPRQRKKIGAPSPSARQRIFAAEYVNDFNGTRAAKAAGYSPRNASNMAQKLLMSETVIGMVRELLDKRAQEVAITRKFLEREALEALVSAKRDRSHAAVRGIIELLAKMSGNLVERREIREIKDWADLTEAELAALAAMEAAPDGPASKH